MAFPLTNVQHQNVLLDSVRSYKKSSAEKGTFQIFLPNMHILLSVNSEFSEDGEAGTIAANYAL